MGHKNLQQPTLSKAPWKKNKGTKKTEMSCQSCVFVALAQYIQLPLSGQYHLTYLLFKKIQKSSLLYIQVAFDKSTSAQSHLFGGLPQRHPGITFFHSRTEDAFRLLENQHCKQPSVVVAHVVPFRNEGQPCDQPIKVFLLPRACKPG